jgi:hypothetical protein
MDSVNRRLDQEAAIRMEKLEAEQQRLSFIEEKFNILMGRLEDVM